MPRMLVVYGTTDGHTAVIARELGTALSECGARVDVVEAKYGSSKPSPRGYDGVIVAASVHIGGFQPNVLHWLRANREALARRPTAFVAVCLAVLQPESEVHQEVEEIIARFLRRAHWVPTLRRTVAGAIPFTRYGWLKRTVMRRIARKMGMATDTSRDYVFTDWDDLKGFARSCFTTMTWLRARGAGRIHVVHAHHHGLSHHHGLRHPSAVTSFGPVHVRGGDVPPASSHTAVAVRPVRLLLPVPVGHDAGHHGPGLGAGDPGRS